MPAEAHKDEIVSEAPGLAEQVLATLPTHARSGSVNLRHGHAPLGLYTDPNTKVDAVNIARKVGVIPYIKSQFQHVRFTDRFASDLMKGTNFILPELWSGIEDQIFAAGFHHLEFDFDRTEGWEVFLKNYLPRTNQVGYVLHKSRLVLADFYGSLRPVESKVLTLSNWDSQTVITLRDTRPEDLAGPSVRLREWFADLKAQYHKPVESEETS